MSTPAPKVGDTVRITLEVELCEATHHDSPGGRVPQPYGFTAYGYRVAGVDTYFTVEVADDPGEGNDITVEVL